MSCSDFSLSIQSTNSIPWTNSSTHTHTHKKKESLAVNIFRNRPFHFIFVSQEDQIRLKPRFSIKDLFWCCKRDARINHLDNIRDLNFSTEPINIDFHLQYHIDSLYKSQFIWLVYEFFSKNEKAKPQSNFIVHWICILQNPIKSLQRLWGDDGQTVTLPNLLLSYLHASLNKTSCRRCQVQFLQ